MATTSPLTSDANTVGLWHMDGAVGSAGKIDNAQGTAALDITEVGTPTSQTGVILPTANGAYQCSAEVNHISIPDHASLDTGSNITIEGWFKTSTSTSGFFHRYTGAANRMFRCVLSSGKLSIIFYDNTDTNLVAVTSTTNVDTGAWVYFAITYDGTNVKMYINPSSSTPEVTSNQVKTLANAASPLIIGTGNPVETTDPTVDVDEWRYSNVARTGTEIFNYYSDVREAMATVASLTSSAITPSVAISMTANASPAVLTASAITPTTSTPAQDWDTQDKTSAGTWTKQSKS